MVLEIPKKGETGTFTIILKDQDDNPVPKVDITVLTLTFKDKKTGAVINNRDSQNVKELNQHTLGDTDGKLTWKMESADNPIMGTGVPLGDIEHHIAEYLFETATYKGRHVESFYVRQILT